MQKIRATYLKEIYQKCKRTASITFFSSLEISSLEITQEILIVCKFYLVKILDILKYLLKSQKFESHKNIFLLDFY